MILRGLSHTIIIGLACLLTSMTLAAASKKSQITILSNNYSGYKLNIAKSIEVSELNKSADIIANTIENWDSNIKANLYIALDIQSLEALQNNKTKAPVLAALLTSNQWSSFNQKYPENSFSSIYYDPDPLKQILLAKTIQPSLESIGILHSENYLIDNQAIKKLAESTQLKVNIILSKSDSDFYEEYAKISSKNDAILLIPDKTIFNRDSIPKAILTSYRQNKFIIGYSKSIVKSGALASTYTSSKDYINDLVATAKKMLNDNSLVTRRFSVNYSIVTNNKVAKSMELILAPIEALIREVNKGLTNTNETN